MCSGASSPKAPLSPRAAAGWSGGQEGVDRSGSGEDVGLGVPLIEACPEPRRRVVRGRLVDVGLLAFIDPRRPGAAELTLCLATRGCAEGQPRRKSQVFQNLPRDGAFLNLSDDSSFASIVLAALEERSAQRSATTRTTAGHFFPLDSTH